MTGPVPTITEVRCIGVKLHVRGRRPLCLQEKAGARPWREETNPPMEVCFSRAGECDIVVKAGD